MGFIDETEVALEAVDHGGVGAEHRAVGAQQQLEGGLPPGVLELGGHAVFGHMAHRQLDEERLEAECGQFAAKRRTLFEVVEHVGVGRESRQGADELLDGHRREAVGSCAAENGVEL
jgi:hypothetical protein